MATADAKVSSMMKLSRLPHNKRAQSTDGALVGLKR